MKDFGFNGMGDDEFKKEFMRFLNMYQSSVNGFMKKNYADKNFMNNPFFNIKPLSNEELENMLNNINDSFNKNETEGWEGNSWESPDGSNPFKKFIHNNPLGGNNNKHDSEIDTFKLLDNKLRSAIINENYEDAAKIRDLINNLKEDQKKENNK